MWLASAGSSSTMVNGAALHGCEKATALGRGNTLPAILAWLHLPDISEYMSDVGLFVLGRGDGTGRRGIGRPATGRGGRDQTCNGQRELPREASRQRSRDVRFAEGIERQRQLA